MIPDSDHNVVAQLSYFLSKSLLFVFAPGTGRREWIFLPFCVLSFHCIYCNCSVSPLLLVFLVLVVPLLLLSLWGLIKFSDSDFDLCLTSYLLKLHSLLWGLVQGLNIEISDDADPYFLFFFLSFKWCLSISRQNNEIMIFVCSFKLSGIK